MSNQIQEITKHRLVSSELEEAIIGIINIERRISHLAGCDFFSEEEREYLNEIFDNLDSLCDTINDVRERL